MENETDMVKKGEPSKITSSEKLCFFDSLRVLAMLCVIIIMFFFLPILAQFFPILNEF